MIFLVISDIHGNLPALEIVLQKEKDNYDSIISLGDVVNYAPWSNECVQLLDDQPDKVLLIGNHEAYFLKGEYSNPGKVSEVFFATSYPKFTEHKKIIEKISFLIHVVFFIKLFFSIQTVNLFKKINYPNFIICQSLPSPLFNQTLFGKIKRLTF